MCPMRRIRYAKFERGQQKVVSFEVSDEGVETFSQFDASTTELNAQEFDPSDEERTIARQLLDETGSGDVSRLHRITFEGRDDLFIDWSC